MIKSGLYEETHIVHWATAAVVVYIIARRWATAAEKGFWFSAHEAIRGARPPPPRVHTKVGRCGAGFLPPCASSIPSLPGVLEPCAFLVHYPSPTDPLPSPPTTPGGPIPWRAATTADDDDAFSGHSRARVINIFTIQNCTRLNSGDWRWRPRVSECDAREYIKTYFCVPSSEYAKKVSVLGVFIALT